MYKIMKCFVLLFVLFTNVGSQDSCAKCFYSSGRKFQCHCVDQCDSDGRCIGSSSHCLTGWFGFRCQYQNLAEYYIKSIEPTRADGLLKNTQNELCNNDSSLLNLSVMWNMSLPFTWLRLKLADNENLNNFNLTFLLTNTNVKTSCINETIFQVDETTIDIHCDLNAATIQFKLEGTIVGSICSVKVSGGRNFAVFQNTSQTSTSANDSINYASRFAVDGVVENNCSFGRCSHTADRDIYPTWSVIFDKPYDVKRFTIFNGLYRVQDRLKQFELEALNDKNATIFYCIDPQDIIQLVYTVLYFNRSLVYGVRINQKPTHYSSYNNPNLVINEFQAFGECSPGYWGLNCEHQCTSPCTDICSTEDGSCYLRCLGYSDEAICSKVCKQGQYGRNCSFKCSTNCTDNKCNSVNGSCFSCLNGMQGTSCEKSCDKYHFGLNCSQLCSKQCLAGTCKSDSGECDSCIQGYHGDYCNIREHSWRTYFGIGFAAGVGSILVVYVIAFLFVYLRRCRSKVRKVKNREVQVYNLPDFFNMDKHDYETARKSIENGNTQCEDVGQTLALDDRLYTNV